MDLKLQNSWDYTSDGSWNWSAYLTGSDLPKVNYVEYVLHPGFPNPVRTVNDPKNGFQLETVIWGPFFLKAFVHFQDGKTEMLKHDVKLERHPEHGRTG